MHDTSLNPDNSIAGTIRHAQNILVSYSKREDRIYLKFAMRDGGGEGVWMTQRTSSGLLAALIKETSREPKLETSRQGTHQAAPSRTSVAVSGFMQEAARLEKKQSKSRPPVDTTEYVDEGLCTYIQLVQKTGGCEIIFTYGPDAEKRCKTHLNFVKIRHLLDALHETYQFAAWPTGSFPQWVKGGGAPHDPVSLN